MASRVPHKLHAVTLIRSGIGRPWWEKRTLRALKLRKLNETVVHKNTPTVNGRLNIVKSLIQVTPINCDEASVTDALKAFEGVNMEEVVADRNLRCKEFLDSTGNFNIDEFIDYHQKELVKLEKKSKETLILEATAKKKKVGKSKKC